MTNYQDVEDAVKLLITGIDCIAVYDFTDRGNACINWYHLSLLDSIVVATTKATVEIVVKKGSPLHHDLERAVASETGNKWVTYDWLVKVTGRILSFCTLDELNKYLALSRAVKAGIMKRGLTCQR